LIFHSLKTPSQEDQSSLKVAENMWIQKHLIVDEVEALDRDEACHQFSVMLNLIFAGLLKDQIKHEMVKNCQGFVQPSKHPKMDLETLDRYYDDAVQEMDYQEVWETACDVSHFMNIKLHDSWKSYLPELPKLARTTIHLALIELEKWPRSSPLTCVVSSILYHGHMNLYYQAYPYPGSTHFNFVNKQN